VALHAERPQHDAEGEAQRLQHRPLLDVELEIRRRILELRASLERAVEVDAVGRERVGKCHSLGVPPPAQLVLVVHRAGGRTGAEQAAPETRALLVRPVDEPYGDRRLTIGGDSAQHLDAGHDVERAVEPASVRHGVDVPADQEDAIGASAQREPLVPGLVGLLLRPDAVELASEPLLRVRPRLGPRHPLGAVLVSGQLPKLSQLLDGAAWLKRHGQRE
jgi:hypothetical protein